MHEGREARWRTHGPWRVETRLLWSPLPVARPGWGLVLHHRAQTVPSLDAALVAARSALNGATPEPQGALRRSVRVFDRSGRRVWQGSDEASLRAAARAAAGWTGPPPLPCAPAHEPPRRTLTDAQLRVVEHPGGPALVVAVAGAGKTTTMVARVRALVRGGVAPERVLVLSFSRAAVADVRAKLAAEGADLDAVHVATFHSLAHGLLREASSRLPDAAPPSAPGPPPEQVSARLLELTLRAWRSEGHPLADDLAALDPAAFLDYRSRCLAHLTLPDPDGRDLPPRARRLVRHAPADPEQPLHAALLAAHEALRRARGWRDYDDLVVDAWAALVRDEGLLERVQRRWTHRIVDECQDVNIAQVALLEALLDERRELMLVGDDDQSIYAFRGSDPALMFELADRLGARRYVLDHTFRTRPEPLAAAADLVARAPGRTAKRVRSARPRGGRITLDVTAGARAEAACVVARLTESHATGVPWQEQAVLLRRFAQTPPIELELLAAGVPYRVVGAPDLLDHPLCRAALAGLHLVAVAGAPRAERARAWRRWSVALGMPSPRAAERAATWASVGDGSARAVAKGHVGRSLPGDAAVLAASERLAQATAAGATAGSVAGLRAAASELVAWPQRGADAARLRSLARAVEAGVFGAVQHDAQALLTAITRWRKQRSATERHVRLTSVHRAKGLEWDVVVVPGQDLGVFPVRNDPEERRLAYVAWTRARERLHLVRDAEREPSPFLAGARVEALLALQDDLAWCLAGVGNDTAAARWAREEARRRFGTEPSGTRDPRSGRT